MEVEAPASEDWPIIGDFVTRYANFPLGGTDASVAVLAQRLGTDLVVTLDRRHFAAVRLGGGRYFTILPD
jgi:predicted nucleic acid-binding protein